MKKLVLVAGLLCSMSAMAAPKGVEIKQSGFDDSKEVTLKPYGTSSCMGFGNQCVSVGALWKSSAPDVVGIDLHTLGKFYNMTNLAINIDGRIIQANRVDMAYDHTLTGRYKQSFQRFVILKDDFDQMLNAQKVWFKISTVGGGYIETNLIDNGKSTLARDGLIRFNSQL